MAHSLIGRPDVQPAVIANATGGADRRRYARNINELDGVGEVDLGAIWRLTSASWCRPIRAIHNSLHAADGSLVFLSISSISEWDDPTKMTADSRCIPVPACRLPATRSGNRWAGLLRRPPGFGADWQPI